LLINVTFNTVLFKHISFEFTSNIDKVLLQIPLKHFLIWIQNTAISLNSYSRFREAIKLTSFMTTCQFSSCK